MQENKIDWTHAETEADVRKVLEEFRARNGIVPEAPDYRACRWCEENVRKYTEEAGREGRKTVQRKLFFVAETGDVGRNDRLIAAVVRLKCSCFLADAELDRILADTPPLLRVQVMEEMEPGACTFRERTFDLVETAVACRAKTVLERLLPYISFDRYDRGAVLDVLK